MSENVVAWYAFFGNFRRFSICSAFDSIVLPTYRLIKFKGMVQGVCRPSFVKIHLEEVPQKLKKDEKLTKMRFLALLTYLP